MTPFRHPSKYQVLTTNATFEQNIPGCIIRSWWNWFKGKNEHFSTDNSIKPIQKYPWSYWWSFLFQNLSCFRCPFFTYTVKTEEKTNTSLAGGHLGESQNSIWSNATIGYESIFPTCWISTFFKAVNEDFFYTVDQGCQTSSLLAGCIIHRPHPHPV